MKFSHFAFTSALACSLAQALPRTTLSGITIDVSLNTVETSTGQQSLPAQRAHARAPIKTLSYKNSFTYEADMLTYLDGARIANKANEFASDIRIFKNDLPSAANAKESRSVDDLYLVKGSKVTVEANGPDEHDAVEAVIEAIQEYGAPPFLDLVAPPFKALHYQDKFVYEADQLTYIDGARISGVAQKYESHIEVFKNDIESAADAKDSRSIQYLYIQKGSVVTVQAEGPDEEEAVKGVIEAFKRYGELPPSVSSVKAQHRLRKSEARRVGL